MPLEVRRLGRTIKPWRDQIVAWHEAMSALRDEGWGACVLSADP
jgi:hypothetical protein